MSVFKLFMRHYKNILQLNSAYIYAKFWTVSFMQVS